MNVGDLYNFYSMLYEVKQQLLWGDWGPTSGQSTIFTNYTTNYATNYSTNSDLDPPNARFLEKSALHQLNSTMANRNLTDHRSIASLSNAHAGLLKEPLAESTTCSSGYSSTSTSTRNSTTNLSFIAQCSSPTAVANCSRSSALSPLTTRAAPSAQTSIEDSPSIDQRKPADQTDSCSSPTVARLMNDANQADVSDSAISSSSSVVGSSSSLDSNNNVNTKLVDSPQLKTPLSDSDLELELESDSILTDRTSEPAVDQTQLLASAFRHHLQALHTILDQMTHSAEYLSRNYELDLDE